MIASIEAPYPTSVPQLNFDGTPFRREQVLQQEELPRQGLIEKLGDIATPTVIRAQIVTENVVSATTDYLKRNGGEVAWRAAMVGLTVATSAGVIGRESRSAEAATGPKYTVAGTAAGGVYSRNTPHNNDTPRIAGRGAYLGDVLTLECGVTDGDPVGNLNNHTWYYAHDNNRNEPDFWINDHYMNTPNAANQLAPGVVRCANESTNPMAQQNSTPQSEVANPMYNRLAAVNWALAHAEDPQTNGDECTKFVSDALWAGGLPQDATWNNNGHYVSGNPIKGHLPTVFTGSKTANTAPMLLDYLEHHYSYQWIPLGPMNAGNNNVPQAEPGDIIAYSWNGPDLKTGQYTIDHLAFVVGAADKNPQYPMVSEWGQLSWDLPINGPKYNLDNPNVHIIERGWTYSELNHMYLQQEPHHQNMTAYLLHFNGGNFVPNY